MRFASRRPLAASLMMVSATMPMDPKMIATPATARSIVQSRSGNPVSSWTSRKPTVVSVMTVM
jgi:hypothetical protein